MADDEKKPADKPGKDVVYVDLDDEITSIIDKVEKTKEKVVALVLPKRASVLQSIVNMRLLKRASQKADKKVVLITNDDALLPLAGAAGLPVAKSLQSKPYIPPSPVALDEAPTPDEPAEAAADEPESEMDENAKIDYNRSIGELAAASEIDEPETIALDDASAEDAPSPAAKTKAPKDKRLKIPNFDKFRLLMFGGVAALVLLIIFLILATKVLPKATITLKTTSLPLSANFSLKADSSAKNLDEDKGIIPSILQIKDQTASTQVQATGQQNNGEKAKGSVSMSAGACSGTVPNDVPAGTGVVTSGLTYITQAKTSFAPVVSGGKCTFQSSKETPITAQAGGAKYNVSSANFTVSGYPGVSASGSASGGTDNITTVVSQADVDSAKQKISSADTDKFSKDLQKQLSDQGNYIISPTLKISDPATSASPEVGAAASTTTVSLKISHSVITVKKDDLRKVVTAQLNKQIDSKKQKLGDEDVLKDLTLSVSEQPSPSSVTLSVSEETTAVPIIDTDSIKKQVGGQKVGDIKNSLANIAGVKEVDVKLSPFWVSKAPKKPAKVKIIQEQVKDSGNSSP